MPALAVAAVATVASSALQASSASKAAKAQKNAAGAAMDAANSIAQDDLDTQKGLYDEITQRYKDQRAETYQNAVAAADQVLASDKAAQDHLIATNRAATDYVNYGFDQAKGELQPYADTGRDALSRLYKTYITGETPYQASDPGYAWRLQQGQQAVERSAAARGGLFSGATGKALTDYAQGAASQEFQAGYNRLAPLASMGVNVAGTLANLDSTRGTTLANLNTALGSKLADINVGQGSKLADLTTWAGAQANGLAQNMNAATDSYGGRTSSILQNLSQAMQGGQYAYGNASASGSLGVGGAIAGGLTNLGNLVQMNGTNLSGSSLGRIGYSSGIVNTQTGRMIGGV